MWIVYQKIVKHNFKSDFQYNFFRTLSSVLLGLILIGSTLEAWKIYATRHERWKESRNLTEYVIIDTLQRPVIDFPYY